MPRIEETALPGVGRRFDFDAEYGKRVGVITHRDGRREVFVASREDPDACDEAIILTPEEAEAVADMLGGSTVTRQVTTLTKEIKGLALDWVTLEEGSPFSGRPLGETMLRTNTGASIVAIVRQGTAIPAPGPAHPLALGDVLVVVDTPAGVLRAENFLNGKPAS
ncbi:cation:proton antiporter regulatory subunit [Deinococcus sp. Marseille-Q6407]|uniref:cation:proton antiporter regulatory subunit n=1 Tax=Deinococcus sp. Marseille-Q6407 TaxID=2969223 RepID=UPI0021BEC04B|nr:cation:proton antiporter regulatory subunit [Deinococcus sp. Marseille-Q6407]